MFLEALAGSLQLQNINYFAMSFSFPTCKSPMTLGVVSSNANILVFRFLLISIISDNHFTGAILEFESAEYGSQSDWFCNTGFEEVFFLHYFHQPCRQGIMGIRHHMIKPILYWKVLKHMLSKLWSVLRYYSASCTIYSKNGFDMHELIFHRSIFW